MNQIGLDPFSICFHSPDESCLNKAIIFWLRFYEKNASGKVYVIPYCDISPEIVQNFSSEKYAWDSAPEHSIAILPEKIDRMGEQDSLVVVGIETIVSGDIAGVSEQLDHLYETANQRLSGLAVLWGADQYCVGQVVDALRDSNNMSIINLQETSAEELRETSWAITERSPEEVLALIEQETTADKEAEKVKYAEKLERSGLFREAAFVFRKLSGKLYDMRARFNDLLADHKEDLVDFQNYVILPFEDDINVFHEAILRTATYFYRNHHVYFTYCALSMADFSKNTPMHTQLAYLRLSILSDTAEASKALRKLRPYSKENDAKKLARERCKALLESIPILVSENSGYYKWREFLNCQENRLWDMELIDELREIVIRYTSTDWRVMLSQSPIYQISLEKNDGNLPPNASQAIYLLRSDFFVERMDPRDRADVMKGAKTQAILEGTVTEQIWVQYYIARNMIRFSQNPQQSISECLLLMERIGSLDGENCELCTTLALLAWANLNYLLDRYQESVACCIAALSRNLDAIPMLEDAFAIIVRYVLECAQKGLIRDTTCFATFFRAISPYNQAAEVGISVLSKDYQSEILRMKARIDGNVPHDSNWAVDVSNLVQLLTMEGSSQSSDEAVQYVLKYHIEIERLLPLREDSAHSILYVLAQALLYGSPTPENLFICISLLENAINRCLARKSGNHQDERASLSISLDRILREQLFICGMLHQCKDLTKDVRTQIKSNILKAASLHIPASMIEQKDYYSNYVSAPIDDKKSERLRSLKQQYYQISGGTSRDVAALERLVAEINLLSEQLSADHPAYKPLKTFEGTDWDELCSILPEYDVFYQYIIAKNVVISILCSSSGVDVTCRSFELDPKEVLEHYGNLINNAVATGDDAEQITTLLAEPLMAYVANNAIQRVFVISDMDCSAFPFAAAQTNGKRLIDQADEIINLIDYTAIERYIHATPSMFPVFNRLYGKQGDPSIKLIHKWLEKRAENAFLFDYSVNDSMDALAEDERVKTANTVAIYGHGVSGFGSGQLDGALRIEGTSQQISLESVIHGLRVNNLIIISCLSGAANEETPETSKGVWKSVLETFAGNIVLCRWSVPTEATIKLIEKTFDFLRSETITLGCALIRAQRELSHKGLCDDKWAGVEFWIN